MKFNIFNKAVKTFGILLCACTISNSAVGSIEVVSSAISPAILNGVDTDLSTVPYQVRLTIQKSSDSGSKYYLCGGSIIDDGVVLTAAHCLEDEGSYATTRIYIYYLDYSDSSNPTQQVAQATVGEFEVNPNWTGSLSGSHDTAVIYLSSDDFANAKKIKVADSDEMEAMFQEFSSSYVANQDNSTNVMASGYGKDEDGVTGTLQRVLLAGIPTDTCDSLSSDNVSGNNIICVQSPTSDTNFGICSGDSGGPLVWQDPDHASDDDYGIRLVGVASYVTTDSGSCRLNGQYYYGGYTSINFFKSEINNAVYNLNGGTNYDINSLSLSYAFDSNPMAFTNETLAQDSDSSTESSNTSTDSSNSNSEVTSSGGGGGNGWIVLLVLGMVTMIRRGCHH